MREKGVAAVACQVTAQLFPHEVSYRHQDGSIVREEAVVGSGRMPLKHRERIFSIDDPICWEVDPFAGKAGREDVEINGQCITGDSGRQ